MDNNGLTVAHAGFEADKESYWKMRPDLLMKYPGKWVAVHKGRVVAVGDDLVSIAGEATREDGYAYTNKVGDEEKIIVRKRRRKFSYDKSYTPTALPRISVKFSNPVFSKNETWDDIIPDTGSDLSSLPNEDCEKIKLFQFPYFQGTSHSFGGGSRQIVFYFAQVEIGAKIFTAIVEPTSEPERLLGREVLNLCKVTFDGPKNQTIFH
jgi:hypothetical protein